MVEDGKEEGGPVGVGALDVVGEEGEGGEGVGGGGEEEERGDGGCVVCVLEERVEHSGRGRGGQVGKMRA